MTAHPPPSTRSTPQLDKYLEALKTVERAMAYFQANNPDNAELTHLTRLRNTALRALEKEFTEVLQRHSTAVDLDTLLAMEDAELTSGNVFADDGWEKWGGED